MYRVGRTTQGLLGDPRCFGACGCVESNKREGIEIVEELALGGERSVYVEESGEVAAYLDLGESACDEDLLGGHE